MGEPEKESKWDVVGRNVQKGSETLVDLTNNKKVQQAAGLVWKGGKKTWEGLQKKGAAEFDDLSTEARAANREQMIRGIARGLKGMTVKSSKGIDWSAINPEGELEEVLKQIVKNLDFETAGLRLNDKEDKKNSEFIMKLARALSNAASVDIPTGGRTPHEVYRDIVGVITVLKHNLTADYVGMYVALRGVSKRLRSIVNALEVGAQIANDASQESYANKEMKQWSEAVNSLTNSAKGESVRLSAMLEPFSKPGAYFIPDHYNRDSADELTIRELEMLQNNGDEQYVKEIIKSLNLMSGLATDSFRAARMLKTVSDVMGPEFVAKIKAGNALDALNENSEFRKLALDTAIDKEGFTNLYSVIEELDKLAHDSSRKILNSAEEITSAKSYQSVEGNAEIDGYAESGVMRTRTSFFSDKLDRMKKSREQLAELGVRGLFSRVADLVNSVKSINDGLRDGTINYSKELWILHDAFHAYKGEFASESVLTLIGYSRARTNSDRRNSFLATILRIVQSALDLNKPEYGSGHAVFARIAEAGKKLIEYLDNSRDEFMEQANKNQPKYGYGNGVIVGAAGKIKVDEIKTEYLDRHLNNLRTDEKDVYDELFKCISGREDRDVLVADFIEELAKAKIFDLDTLSENAKNKYINLLQNIEKYFSRKIIDKLLILKADFSNLGDIAKNVKVLEIHQPGGNISEPLLKIFSLIETINTVTTGPDRFGEFAKIIYNFEYKYANEEFVGAINIILELNDLSEKFDNPTNVLRADMIKNISNLNVAIKVKHDEIPQIILTLNNIMLKPKLEDKDEKSIAMFGGFLKYSQIAESQNATEVMKSTNALDNHNMEIMAMVQYIYIKNTYGDLANYKINDAKSENISELYLYQKGINDLKADSLNIKFIPPTYPKLEEKMNRQLVKLGLDSFQADNAAKTLYEDMRATLAKELPELTRLHATQVDKKKKNEDFLTDAYNDVKSNLTKLIINNPFPDNDYYNILYNIYIKPEVLKELGQIEQYTKEAKEELVKYRPTLFNISTLRINNTDKIDIKGNAENVNIPPFNTLIDTLDTSLATLNFEILHTHGIRNIQQSHKQLSSVQDEINIVRSMGVGNKVSKIREELKAYIEDGTKSQILKQIYTERAEAQINLYKCAENLDIMLQKFSVMISGDVKLMKDLHTIINNKIDIAGWYDDKSGDNLAKFFTEFNAELFDPTKGSYIEQIKSSDKDSSILEPQNPNKYDEVKKKLEEAISGVAVLKNLINLFYRISESINADKNSSFLSPVTFFKHLKDYLIISSIRITDLRGRDHISISKVTDGLKDEDILFMEIIKAMFGKFLVAVNLERMSRQPISKALMRKVRSVIGSNEIPLPKLDGERAELYFYLVHLCEYYRKLFNMDTPDDVKVDGLSHFLAIIPEDEGVFGRFIFLIFEKYKDNKGNYSDQEMRDILKELEKIHDKLSAKASESKRAIFDYVIDDFIIEMNKRFVLMTETDKKAYRAILDDQYGDAVKGEFNKANDAYAILPGETVDKPYDGQPPSDMYADGAYSKIHDSSKNYTKVKIFDKYRDLMRKHNCAMMGEDDTKKDSKNEYNVRDYVHTCKKYVDEAETSYDKYIEVNKMLSTGTQLNISSHYKTAMGLEVLGGLIVLDKMYEHYTRCLHYVINMPGSGAVGRDIAPTNSDLYNTTDIMSINTLDSFRLTYDYIDTLSQINSCNHIKDKLKKMVDVNISNGIFNVNYANLEEYSMDLLNVINKLLSQLKGSIQNIQVKNTIPEEKMYVYILNKYNELNSRIRDELFDRRNDKNMLTMNKMSGYLKNVFDSLKKGIVDNNNISLAAVEALKTTLFWGSYYKHGGVPYKLEPFRNHNPLWNITSNTVDKLPQMRWKYELGYPEMYQEGENFNSVMMEVNRVMMQILLMFHDQGSGKIYKKLLEPFITGNMSYLVMGDGAYMDTIPTLMAASGISAKLRGPELKRMLVALDMPEPNNTGDYDLKLNGYMNYIRMLMENDNATVPRPPARAGGPPPPLNKITDAASVKSVYNKFKSILPEEVAYIPSDFNVTGNIGWGHRPDPKPNQVMFASLASIIRALAKNENLDKTPKHLYGTLSEIPEYVIEMMRANIPYYIARLTAMINKLEIVKNVVSSIGEFKDHTSTYAKVFDIFGEYENWGNQEFKPKSLQFAESMKEYCLAIISTLETVYKEIGDEPVHMELSKGYISDYRSRYNHNPIMPLSLTLTEKNPKGQFSYGSNDFKYQMGKRIMYLQNVNAEKFEGMYNMVNAYNNYSQESVRLNKSDIDRFIKLYAELFKTSYYGNINKDLVSGAINADADGVKPPPTGGASFDIPYHKKDLTKGVIGKDIETITKGTPLFSYNKEINNIVPVVSSPDINYSLSQLISECVNDPLGATDRETFTNQIVKSLNRVPINMNLVARYIPLANIYNYAYASTSILAVYYGADDQNSMCDELIDDSKLAALFVRFLHSPYGKNEKAEDSYLKFLSHYSAGGVGLDMDLGRVQYNSDQIFGKVLAMSQMDWDLDESVKSVTHRIPTTISDVLTPQKRQIKTIGNSYNAGDTKIYKYYTIPNKDTKEFKTIEMVWEGRAKDRFNSILIRNLVYMVFLQAIGAKVLKESVFAQTGNVERGLPTLSSMGYSIANNDTVEETEERRTAPKKNYNFSVWS